MRQPITLLAPASPGLNHPDRESHPTVTQASSLCGARGVLAADNTSGVRGAPSGRKQGALWDFAFSLRVRVARKLFGAAAAFTLTVGFLPAAIKAEAVPDLHIRELSENLFQLGEVRFDKNTKSAMFPATASLREGLAEYLIVTETGKAYESVLQTTATPFHIHAAMLLLGVKASGTATMEPPQQIDAAYLEHAPKLTGDEVEITVAWNAGGKEHRVAAEELIRNPTHAGSKKTVPWLYTGSMLFEGKLLAQMEGSIAALVIDPAALINNPRPGNDDDHSWTVRTESLPPAGVTAEVTLRLLPQGQAKKAAKKR